MAERFSAGSTFKHQGIDFEVEGLLPNGMARVKNLMTGISDEFSVARLTSLLFSGELRFLTSHVSIKIEAPSLPLSDYGPKLVTDARKRLEAIEPLLLIPHEDRTRAKVDARSKECGASTASLYRWLNMYENSDNDLRSLISNYEPVGNEGEPRIDSIVLKILNAVIDELYMKREKADASDVWSETTLRVSEENRVRREGEQLVAPSESSVRRHIERLDVRERYGARHGKRAAARQFSQYGQMDRPDRLGLRAAADHTKMDLVVVDDEDGLPLGRLTYTAMYEESCAYPYGYYTGFEPPSYYSVMECAYHSFRPKGDVKTKYGTEHDWPLYGIPEVLRVDNGREFIGDDLKDAGDSLGFVVDPCTVKQPWEKGGMERTWRTNNTGLFHTLPGTTFSSFGERGDYQSEEQACIGTGDIDSLIHMFLLDIYAERYNQGLQGVPARRLETLMGLGFSPRLPSSEDELRVLLGKTEMRTVQHYGIEFERLRFNCPELADVRAVLKGKQTKIKIHPGDLSHINAFNPITRKYIEVPALAQDYTNGLSLWKHKVIRRFALQEYHQVDYESLARAKRRMREIVGNARATQKQALSRTRIARYETSGKPTRDLHPPQQAAALPESVSTASIPNTGVAIPDKPVVPQRGLLFGGNDDGWGTTLPLGTGNDDIAKTGDER